MQYDGAYAERIALLVDRLGQLVRELQFAEGLNPAQWEALRYLGRANRYSRSPGACAEFLGTTKGTASQTLIALEQKGYIERQRSSSDRRQIHIRLTDTGRALLRRDPMVNLQRAAAHIAHEDSAEVIKALSLLLHDLQHYHGVRTFGVCRECKLFCVEGSPGRAQGSHHCGMTGETLADADADSLCVNFQGVN
jgi:DNA-binding MarR family transcriptional regulator